MDPTSLELLVMLMVVGEVMRKREIESDSRFTIKKDKKKKKAKLNKSFGKKKQEEIKLTKDVQLKKSGLYMKTRRTALK